MQDNLDILAAADIHLNEDKLKAMYEENYDSNAIIEYFHDLYADKEEQLRYVNALLDGDIFSFLIHRLIDSYYDTRHLFDPLLLFSYMRNVSLGAMLAFGGYDPTINNVDVIKDYNDCIT